MLGTLATHPPSGAARRVDPTAAAERPAVDAPDAAAPPRRGAPRTVDPDAVAPALAALSRGRAEPGSLFAARLDVGPDDDDAPDVLRASARGDAAAPKRAASPTAASLTAASLTAASLTAADPAAATPDALADPPPAARSPDPLQSGLSEEQIAQVTQMSQRDREVRAHETAHVIAGRPWAGPAVYLYQTGPDGRRYAIGGFAPIDASPIEGNPEATAAKMRIVIDAALSPPDPSPADRHVAALAQVRLQAALAALAEASRLSRMGDEAGADAARQRVSTRI
ncbi:putative metalloprotease CJM1_0395 family protein [uncultured Albimonas sp.]|uniref:putative metalloprotease CJM1_0395 family protein n=1 Tax=uncultured Albimonas sp. TaxID=1331701 RepID=UPI0030EE77A2